MESSIDYRKLNDLTIDGTFPIPNMENLFANLENSQYFSTMDLATEFHQIPILSEDRHKAAISTSNGDYEFTMMPIDLENASASFQRTMNKVFRDNICGPSRRYFIILEFSSRKYFNIVENFAKNL